LNEAGIATVEVPAAASPNAFLVDVGPALEYGFQEAINEFLANLGTAAPLASLREIVAFNSADAANRAPYGQAYLEGSLNTAITASEYAALEEGNQATARGALDELFEKYELDVLLVDFGQLYAPAGYPALTVPSGYTEDGAPQGVIFVGRYLSEPQLLAVGYAYEQATQARIDPDLEATMELIESTALTEPIEQQEEPEMAQAKAKEEKPQYVKDLEAAYGAPSQAGFGSAVFYAAVDPAKKLEEAALEYYHYFVGDLWERWGEDAWMGPWKEVYARKDGVEPDIVAELKGITDADAKQSVPMILEVVENAEAARKALAAAYDDPAVTELRVYNLGDGEAMSGLLVAGRRDSGDATFLVFLMD